MGPFMRTELMSEPPHDLYRGRHGPWTRSLLISDMTLLTVMDLCRDPR